MTAEAKSERTEKQVDKTPTTPHVTVGNAEMDASRLSRPAETRPNVVDASGTVKFSDLYGSKSGGADVTPAAARPADASGRSVDASGQPTDRTQTPGRPTDNTNGGDKPVNPAEVQQQKTRLEALTKGMTADQASEVQKDMAAIENRHPPLTADQVNKVYDQTSRLIENKDNKSTLSPEERNQLAAGILHNASLRTGLDQGFHNTCNVSTLDRRLNVLHPEEAARMVSEAGQYGQFKSGDGKIIKLDPSGLKPDGEANMKFGDKATDGKRDYASQVFDQCAVNDHWQRQHPPLFYSQGPKDSQSDTGERMRYADGREVNGPDGKPMRQPGLTLDDMAKVGKRMGFEGQYIIGNADAAGGPNTDGAQKVHNYQEFQDALSKNQPPAVILVNSNDKLFGGNGDKGGSGGWHVVTVSDYQAGPPPSAQMTNQWGAANNKRVSMSELYNATLPTNSGRVDSNGNPSGDTGGDRHQGPGPGGDTGGGGRHWNRNDGVMRDEDQRKWRHDVVEPNAPKEKAKDPQDQEKQQEQQRKNQAHQHALDQVSPLQSRLREAQLQHNDAEAADLQAQIQFYTSSTA